MLARSRGSRPAPIGISIEPGGIGAEACGLCTPFGLICLPPSLPPFSLSPHAPTHAPLLRYAPLQPPLPGEMASTPPATWGQADAGVATQSNALATAHVGRGHSGAAGMLEGIASSLIGRSTFMRLSEQLIGHRRAPRFIQLPLPSSVDLCNNPSSGPTSHGECGASKLRWLR